MEAVHKATGSNHWKSKNNEPNKNNEIVKVILGDILRDCENILEEHKDDNQHCDTVVKDLCEVTPQETAMYNYIIKQPTEKPKDIPSSTSTKAESFNKRNLEELPEDENLKTFGALTNPVKRGKLEQRSEAMQIVKKQIKRLSKQDLEKIVEQKVVEMISCRSEIGVLRAKCDKLEEMNETWKSTTKTYQKMCQDLNTVVKRYVLDVQNKKENPTPIKITRSVGLQVLGDQRPRVPISHQRLPESLPQKDVIQERTVKIPRPIPTTANNIVNSKEDLVKDQISPKTSENLTFVSVQNNTSIRQTSLHNARPSPQTQAYAFPKVDSQVPLTEKINGPSKPGISSIEKRPLISPGSETLSATKEYSDKVKSNDLRVQKRASSPEITILGVKPNKQIVNGGNVQKACTLGINNSHHNRELGLSHPMPLPDMPNPQPHSPSWKKIPPRPILQISKMKTGIVLSWNFNVMINQHEEVESYQIYAYQETSLSPLSKLWKKIGDVKALPLPMACTLTQFTKGNKYHFAVRAKDVHSRVGNYSNPQSIALV